MITIYIHGFSSNGKGNKAKLFREFYKNTNELFIAPSLSYIPELAIQTLEELIESYGCNVKLIGSSLGGYYSIYLAHKYGLNAILINPAVHAPSTLQKFVGTVTSFYDGSKYEWNEKHIEMLKNYQIEEINPVQFMVLLQKGDETLNYKEVATMFQGSKLIIEEGGSHGFDNIENHFQDILEFDMVIN